MVFGKVYGAMKDFTNYGYGMIKEGAMKYGPSILDAIETGAGVMKHIPAANPVLAAISTAAGATEQGLKAAREYISGVPNKELKEKLEKELNTNTVSENAVAREHVRDQPTVNLITPTTGRIPESMLPDRSLPTKAGPGLVSNEFKAYKPKWAKLFGKKKK